MIINVNWQYVLLNGNSTIGFRVKRRTTGPPPLAGAGTDAPMSDNWVSAPAPPQIHLVSDNKDYIFAFWSLVDRDTQSPQSTAQIQVGAVANVRKKLLRLWKPKCSSTWSLEPAHAWFREQLRTVARTI